MQKLDQAHSTYPLPMGLTLLVSSGTWSWKNTRYCMSTGTPDTLQGGAL